MYATPLDVYSRVQGYIAANSYAPLENSSGYFVGGYQQNGNSSNSAATQQSATSYDQECQEALNRMDAKENGGNGDGKVSVDEAIKGLNIDSLFDGMEKDSKEYKNLKKYTDKIPAAVRKYAGSDQELNAQEYADLIDGEEWSNLIETYRKSSSWAAFQMQLIDNNQVKDNVVTTTEVLAEIYSKFSKLYSKEDGSILEKISKLVYKYAGSDNIFTKEEYTKLLNDSKYSEFIDKHPECAPSTQYVA